MLDFVQDRAVRESRKETTRIGGRENPFMGRLQRDIRLFREGRPRKGGLAGLPGAEDHDRPEAARESVEGGLRKARNHFLHIRS